MKLILTLLSLFTVSKLNVTVDDDYVNQIKSSYEEYVLVEEYTNNYYDLQLYAGKINEKIYYGIYFKNKIPNEYNLKLFYNNKDYVLPATTRGDVMAPAVDLSNTENFSIVIYDKNDFYQYGINSFQNIDTLDLEEFNKVDNKLTGLGQGVNEARVRSNFKIEERLIIYIVLVSVLLACGIIVFIYSKKKRGMFNPDIKSANVFNFKSFLNAASQDMQADYNEETKDKTYNDIYEEENPVEVKEEPSKERIVNPTYVWHHYEEEKSDFDFKTHLNGLNLPTNYETASLEDKNKIMLELMRLKDQNKITQDDYLDEISELWKK